MDNTFGQPGYLESSSTGFEKIFYTAITQRASDIHFEPGRDKLNIRIRVDGILHLIESIDKSVQENMLSRIKVLAQLNIAEHRLPQDGHYEINYEGKYYNFRVSTLPTAFGETIVFRVLNREDVLIPLESIGLLPNQIELVYKLIMTRSKLLLTTGPTGSGKTSLMYSLIKIINQTDKSIVTVEDPIEYEMDQVQQSQVNESVGLTFAKVMRSILRQDPDYIMVGEIRDAETAQLAIQAALSGTLVLSTFHTFDVPALVNRLIEMGISNTIVAQSIKGVISTRLVRKICENCKVPYQFNDIEKKIWDDRPVPQHTMIGQGCDKCLKTGYFGRTGLFEIVFFDSEIQTTIIERKPASVLYDLMNKKKTQSLREIGYEKVSQGITTLSEIIRVLGVL